MGSGNWDKDTAQGIAQKAIAVAEARQDAVAFISPYRGAFLSDNSVGTVTVNDIDTITENVVSYYASLSSTTYGVFDSGYKYMYCLLYTSPSPRDTERSRMPSSA